VTGDELEHLHAEAIANLDALDELHRLAVENLDELADLRKKARGGRDVT